ncbi:lipoprotein signal peptidase [Klebsiella michiganensis]|nr:lipoprotein signal peptidase [Klebsiella michiganensis]
MAGALGNLFDRLWHGFVVDMIDFYVGNWHFATFNLADTAICIGAALIVLEGFLPNAAAKKQAVTKLARRRRRRAKQVSNLHV